VSVSKTSQVSCVSLLVDFLVVFVFFLFFFFFFLTSLYSSSMISHRRHLFKELHKSGTFLIPNPFDAGSAKLLESTGLFRALATSSAGFAFSLGQPDSMTSVSLELVLEHLRALTEASSLPINADFQNGYSRKGDYATLKKNVILCAETGVAGLSIEDVDSDGSLFPFDEAVERVKVARAALDQSAPDVLLTARCEAFLLGLDDVDEVLRRLIAFSKAGADVLYAPNVYDRETISRIVAAVAPKPVNVLVSSSKGNLTVKELTALGVRRISVGSALARVALGSVLHAAQQIANNGSFEALDQALSFGKLNEVFEGKKN
jgi:2-methylisocitrate lyase-like PEP mutase family enzyme